MATTATYTKTGDKASVAAKLDKSIFGLEVSSHELLKTAYLSHLASARSAGATTKTRGLVRGGGKKPWRQKGTGRARFGSSRNPIWRGGGIVFGPTGEQNFTIRLSTTKKRQAIRQALSLAADAGKLIVVESLAFKEAKVKAATELLSKLGAKGNILIAVDVKDENLMRATRNIQFVKVTDVKYLSVYDIMNSDTIVVSQKALPIINSWLGSAA